jgi:hypothetical protein
MYCCVEVLRGEGDVCIKSFSVLCRILFIPNFRHGRVGLKGCQQVHLCPGLLSLTDKLTNYIGIGALASATYTTIAIVPQKRSQLGNVTHLYFGHKALAVFFQLFAVFEHLRVQHSYPAVLIKGDLHLVFRHQAPLEASKLRLLSFRAANRIQVLHQ